MVNVKVRVEANVYVEVGAGANAEAHAHVYVEVYAQVNNNASKEFKQIAERHDEAQDSSYFFTWLRYIH